MGESAPKITGSRTRRPMPSGASTGYVCHDSDSSHSSVAIMQCMLCLDRVKLNLVCIISSWAAAAGQDGLVQLRATGPKGCLPKDGQGTQRIGSPHCIQHVVRRPRASKPTHTFDVDILYRQQLGPHSQSAVALNPYNMLCCAMGCAMLCCAAVSGARRTRGSGATAAPSPGERPATTPAPGGLPKESFLRFRRSQRSTPESRGVGTIWSEITSLEFTRSRRYLITRRHLITSLRLVAVQSALDLLRSLVY